MRQVPERMTTKKGKDGSAGRAMAAALLCSWLCLVPLGFGEAESLDDYEFQRIKEAYKVKETAFGLSPEVRDFWEGQEGNGNAARAQTVLASKKESLDNNPFYHLFLGEIYFLQQDQERAQDEWNKAVTLTEDDLFIRWLLLREHCLKRHYEEAERELAEIIRLQAKGGANRLPMLSSQVTLVAEQLRDRQDLSLALSLINLALHLDSHSAEAGYVKASILWKMSRYNFPGVIDNIFHAVREGFTEERNLYGLSANLLSALISAYFFLFLVAGAVIFYKYESLLRHEFMERVKIDLRPPVSFFLFGLLYLGPIFCFLGWGWLLLFWVLLVFPYSIPKERIILSLLILSFCFLPPLCRLAASLLRAQSDPLLEAAQAVEEGRVGGKLANFFARQVQERRGDPIPHFYFGLLLKSKGELEQAEKEFQAAIERLPNPGVAHNNLGNIYFLEERFEEAEGQYRKAIANEPYVASTHMNLSLLLALFPERLRIEEAKAESDIAEGLEPGITQRMGSYEDPLSERRLLYQHLPKEDLRKRLWAPSREKDLLADSLWGERIRFLPLQALPLFPIAFLLLLWTSLQIRMRGPNPKFCQECGKIFCSVCQKESLPEPSCSSCYSVFHLREVLNPQLRIDSLIRRDRRGEKEKRKVRAFSFFPGAASLYLGRSWWGMGHAAIFLFLLIYWTGWSKIVPAISPLPQNFAPLGGGFLLMLLLVLYGTSVQRGLKWSA